MNANSAPPSPVLLRPVVRVEPVEHLQRLDARCERLWHATATRRDSCNVRTAVLHLDELIGRVHALSRGNHRLATRGQLH